MLLKRTFFTDNRRKLSKSIGGGLVVITANGLLQRTGDSVYPFRQDSNFFYLTGLNEPDLLLAMDGEDEFLVLPKRSHAENIFGGSVNRDEIAKVSGIARIFDHTEGWARVKKLQLRRKKVQTITAPPRRVVHTDGFSTNPNRRYLIEKLKRLYPAVEIKDLRPTITELRQVKQPDELEAIKSAIAVTGEGLNTAKKLIETGVSGYELKAELDKTFAMNGLEHGFTPIVTSGYDTAIMHSLNYGKKISANENVLFDIGAEAENYSADISRTYFNGRKTSRYQDVHSAVALVKKESEKLVRPGLNWRQWAVKTDEIMGEQLIKLGLITKNERKQVRKYFSHAIGHSLGLDVHDVCDYTEPLRENMVITIEPGIYIPKEGFGVRIEDDYLVTKNGVENLSAGIPIE